MKWEEIRENVELAGLICIFAISLVGLTPNIV